MSSLRRRVFGSGTPDSTPDISRESSPAPLHKGDTNGDDYRVIHTKQLDKLRDRVKHTGRKRRNAWIFGLGGLFGVVLAGFFAASNNMDLVELAGLKDVSLDSILDVLPAGIIKDVREMQVSYVRLILLHQADVDKRSFI